MAFQIKNKSLVIIIVILGLLAFSPMFLSIFVLDIPFVTSSATCTGSISGVALSDADCKGLGPIASGSSANNWAYSTSGTGTITLPQPSQAVAINGRFRNFQGTASLEILNTATGNYDDPGFSFDPDATYQTRTFGSNYLDTATHEIVTFRWNMQCSGQCVAGVQQFKATQYDTIQQMATTSILGTTTTTTTATTSTVVSTPGSITTTIGTTSTSSIQYIAGTTSTTSVIGQVAAPAQDNTVLIVLVVIAGVAAIYFYQKRR